MHYDETRHGHHVDRWVVIDGVRTSYRGKLVGVKELHGGEALLYLQPCYALESLADTDGEVEINTAEAPWDLYASACLGVGRQPKGWPES